MVEAYASLRDENPSLLLLQHQHQPGTPTAKQRAHTKRQLTEQAELAYQRLIQDRAATANTTMNPHP